MTHSSSDGATPPNEYEKGAVNEHLETIRTVSRIPGNDHYYNKDGLRTYGDDEDHDHEPPVSIRFIWHACRMLTVLADDWLAFHVPCCYGLPMDWLADPGLSLR